MTANRQLESVMHFVNFGILSKCRGIVNTCASRLSFTIIMRNPSLSNNAYPGALELTHVTLIPYAFSAQHLQDISQQCQSKFMHVYVVEGDSAITGYELTWRGYER